LLLRERAELRKILELEKSNENGRGIEVLWEHRVLRRSFDGDLATQPDLRFHRDALPDVVESGVLCAFTVVTVLKNDNLLGEEAGTVFKLDTQFDKRADPLQIITQELPKLGDGFVYWYSSSRPGTATIFNNCDDVSQWLCTDGENVTLEYSWSPQMAHSVAAVKQQRDSSKRSRTILQTKVVFRSSPVSSKGDELIERLRVIGLGRHLFGLRTSLERRYDDDGDGPYSFQEFFEMYEELDSAISHWNEAGPSIFFPFGERDHLQRRHLPT